MLLKEEREEVVYYCKEMLRSGLTTGTGGNISKFNREKKLFAISPSGLSYEEMKPEDVVVLDLAFEKVDGDLKPSSEYHMHGIFYQKREDIDAVVHSHSKNATAMACLGWDLPPFYYLNMIGGRDILCTPYTRFGTEVLADLALEYMKERYAVLLGNHGLLSGADSMKRAYTITELIEKSCGVYLQCKTVGEPRMLSEEQINEMMRVFHNREYI